jgi:rhodanese-related sulfurtransferase
MSIFSKLFGKSYATVDGAKALQIVSDGGVLVDVRTTGEWNAGHAPTAMHIPLDQLDRKMSQLRTGVPIVTVCKSGVRSGAAARSLAGHGFEVSSVRGGMRAWQHAGGRVIAKSGREGTV